MTQDTARILEVTCNLPHLNFPCHGVVGKLYERLVRVSLLTPLNNTCAPPEPQVQTTVQFLDPLLNRKRKKRNRRK